MAGARAPFRVELLGQLRVWRGTEQIDLGPAKQRAVFALLALRAGDSVSVGELQEAVWGTPVPANARSLLHTYLARLRQILEPEQAPRRRVHVIASTASGYCLHEESVETDVARFRHWLTRAGERTADGATAEAFTLLCHAVHAWRDPLLTELSALLHTCYEVEALRANWVTAARAYVSAGLRLGHSAAVLATAARLAALEPLHEAIQADYLAVLGSTGQRAVALERFGEVCQRLRTELGIEPGLELRTVHRTLLRPGGRPRAEARTPSSSRMVWRGCRPGAGRLLWREDDLAGVARTLDEQRVVTVTGPPGCGKSAVTLRVAAQRGPSFADGVVVVDTLDLNDRRQLERRIARLLGGDGSEDLVSLLDQRQVLLVFDNAEHLVDACALVTDRLVRSCRQVVVVTSSRQPLNLPYERIWRLRPLPVPEPGPLVRAAESPAVALFVERAAQARPGFRLTRQNAAAVTAVCRRLDGLPLALELAAACLATDSLDGLLHRLDGPLDDLRPPRRALPAHHRSLRAMLDRSVDRLDAVERWCFQQIGLLPEVFDLAAARRVCEPHPCGPVDVRVVLAALVEKSLLVLVVGHRPRYRMLGVLRRLAAEWAGDAEVNGDLPVEQPYGGRFVPSSTSRRAADGQPRAGIAS